MPATRSSSRASSRVNSKGQGSASRIRSSIVEGDDDVIVISSSDEGPDNVKLALRKAQREVRALRKSLAKELSRSVQAPTSQIKGTTPRTRVSRPPDTRSQESGKEEERLRLQLRHHQALTNIMELQSALRCDTELRNKDFAMLVQLKKRVTMVEDENAMLKIVNEDLRNTITGGNKTNNSALQDLESHILCEICTETLWHPYTLTGCGHTFCQGCLIDWFDVTIQAAVAANAHHVHYSCPTCRAPVYTKPIEDFALKGVVRAVARAIDPAGRTSSPAPRNQHERGPWARFFS